MLYWICPECGHECSPAIRECPTCTAPPRAAEAAETAVEQTAAESTGNASQELLSFAKHFSGSFHRFVGGSSATPTAHVRKRT